MVNIFVCSLSESLEVISWMAFYSGKKLLKPVYKVQSSPLALKGIIFSSVIVNSKT